MEEKIRNNDVGEIDLQRLFGALLNKSWLIGIVAVAGAVAAFLFTLFFVTPTYKSSAMFYVNNTDISVGGSKLSLSAADISASRGLVDTYIVILNTRETMLDVIDYAGLDLSYEQIKGMVSAASVNETEVFRVTVTNADPYQAERIANAIAYILPKRISTIIDGSAAKIVDTAVAASSPSSPSYTSNTLKGFLAGLVLSCAVVVLMELLDITIRTEDDITQTCTHPVLAAVPDMGVQTKGGSYYGYGRRPVEKGNARNPKRNELVGGNISFAAAEAYKLLRTKLLFSFADEQNCRVIGVSSALTGEGKSLSAVNLAYSMSQLGMRVLLIDCDMRRPSLAEKLPIQKTPGLSDYLSGQSPAETLIQLCGMEEDQAAFHAIAPGRTPPNPMELLSSQRMEKMVAALRKNYDYIILDLPPVGEVGDALAASKLTDGMLLVVRQNLCDRVALNTTIRQLEFVDAKILGVVFNCTTEDGSAYGNKYQRRYYKKYYNAEKHKAQKA